MPDRRGRVTIQTAGAKLTLPREQLGRAASEGAGTRGAAGGGGGRSGAGGSGGAGSDRESHADRGGRGGRREPPPPMRLGGVAEIDLRGLRAEDALERLDAGLDEAAALGRDELRVIHGIGTGALRRAVREFLPRSHWVVEFREAAREEGGAGATLVVLRKD